MAKKAPISKRLVKSAVVSKKKAAVSPAKHTEKPVKAQPTPELTPVIKRKESAPERKVGALRERLERGSTDMTSERVVNFNLNLRIIELLEEIRDALNRPNGG